MAKLHCSKDIIVVVTKTSLFVYRYAAVNQKLNLTPLKTVEVDFDVESCKKSITESFGIKENDDHSSTHSEKNCAKGHPQAQFEKQILASAFSKNGLYFAVATSLKTCIVYDTAKGWSIRCPIFKIPKAPTSVTFDSDCSYVIVADRAGNVIRYNLTSGNNVENRDEFLLGHVSMVLDTSVSSCGKYICTADRDEKIRISRYPQSFVIHRFCLGHESYVNCVVSVKNFIFSSGGDGTIRVWSVSEGNLVGLCDFFEGKQIRKCKIDSASNEGVFKIAILLEDCSEVTIVSYHSEIGIFKRLYSLTETECITDVEFIAGSAVVIAVTKKGLLFATTETETSWNVVENVEAEILASLAETKDVPLSLEKKVGFNNVDEYQQRKINRIQARKRKLETA